MSWFGDPVAKDRLAAECALPVGDEAQRQWRTAGLFTGFVLLVLFGVYFETIGSMVAIWWRSETFTHGFLIFPLTGWMIWNRRGALARIPPAPAPAAVVLLLGAGFVWLLGHWADVLVVQQLMLVAMVPLAVIALLGVRVARCIMFPLVYLFFAVPMGLFLVPHMQNLTAAFAVKALQLTGIPVFWEGHFIVLTNGTWKVAEACSGVRYLIASVAVGTIYAYLTFTRYWKRIVFIVFAALVPLAANGIRAYSIVLVGYVFGSGVARGIDHIIWGWIFFGIVMLIMFSVGSLWRDPDERLVDDSARHGAEEGSPADVRTYSGSSRFLVVGVVVVVAAGLWPVLALTEARANTQTVPIHSTLPAGQSGWAGPYASDLPWKPKFSPGGLRVHKQYRRGSQVVDVLLIGYGRQRQGAEMINSDNRLFDEKLWRRTGESNQAVRLEDGDTLDVHETQLNSPAGNRILWSWYVVGNHHTASRTVGKFWGGWTRLMGHAGPSYVVMLAAPYQWSPQEGRSVLRDFLHAIPRFATPGSLMAFAAASSSQ